MIRYSVKFKLRSDDRLLLLRGAEGRLKRFSYMTRIITYLLIVLFSTAPMSICADEKTEFFEKKIRPVLVKHCYECQWTGGCTRQAEAEPDSGGVTV